MEKGKEVECDENLLPHTREEVEGRRKKKEEEMTREEGKWRRRGCKIVFVMRERASLSLLSFPFYIFYYSFHLFSLCLLIYLFSLLKNYFLKDFHFYKFPKIF